MHNGKDRKPAGSGNKRCHTWHVGEHMTFPGLWNTWLFGCATAQEWAPVGMLAKMEKPHRLHSWSWNPQNAISALAVPPPETYFLQRGTWPTPSLTLLSSVIERRAWDPSTPFSEIALSLPALALFPQCCYVCSSKHLLTADTSSVTSLLYRCAVMQHIKDGDTL